jgi:hypothetical protein
MQPSPVAIETQLTTSLRTRLEKGACCNGVETCVAVEAGLHRSAGQPGGSMFEVIDPITVNHPRAWAAFWTDYVPHVMACDNVMHLAPWLGSDERGTQIAVRLAEPMQAPEVGWQALTHVPPPSRGDMELLQAIIRLGGSATHEELAQAQQVPSYEVHHAGRRLNAVGYVAAKVNQDRSISFVVTPLGHQKACPAPE